jgi:hypothetical protein
MPALPTQSPEFKPQSHQKKKKHNNKTPGKAGSKLVFFVCLAVLRFVLRTLHTLMLEPHPSNLFKLSTVTTAQMPGDRTCKGMSVHGTILFSLY